MILGEDWLEAVSPIWVDYKTKHIRVTLNGKRVALCGIQDKVDMCPAIGPKKLLTACSVGWFVSLLVCEEVLLASLCERKILFRLKIYDRI